MANPAQAVTSQNYCLSHFVATGCHYWSISEDQQIFYACKTNSLLIWRKWNIILLLIIVYKNLTDHFPKPAQHACFFVCNCEGAQAQTVSLHCQATSSSQGGDLGIQGKKAADLEWWCHFRAAWSRSSSIQPGLMSWGMPGAWQGREGAGTLPTLSWSWC